MMSGKSVHPCGKCKSRISKSQGAIFCENCKTWIHLSCSGVDNIELKVLQKLKTKWICEDCKRKTEREIRRSIQHTDSALTLVTTQCGEQNEEQENLMISIRELAKEIKELKTSMNFYSQQYEDQRQRNEECAEEIKQLRKVNEETQREIRFLKQQNTIKDQQSRTCNVVNVGIQNSIEDLNSNGREIKLKTDKIISHLDKDIKTTDYQLQALSKNKANSPILISFAKEQHKNNLMRKRKEKGKIKGSDCGLEESGLIFINDDLSKEVRELFRNARRLRHEGGFKFIWVKSGTVYARKNDGSDIYKIKCANDIENLLSQ